MKGVVSTRSAKGLLTSLIVGAIGGTIFQLTGLPLAWMLGPLVANLLVSSRGVNVVVPERLRNVFLAVMGLVLGSQVTPELAQRVVDWPISAVLLLAGISASTVAASAWYRRCGFDSVSAWFAAAPGAMTAMIILGDKCGGDPQRIAIAQSIRVILVILVLPPLFWAYEGGDGDMALRANEFEHAWMLLLIPLLLPLGRWLRFPTPALLVPLLTAALLSGFDIASLRLPDWGMNLMLWVLGSAIGSRFKGMTRRLWGRYLWQSGIATLLALMVLALFAELIHQFVGVGRDVALLALAPGGVGEMAILAVALNIDPVFVAFHHLLRMVTLMVFAPFWARWLLRHQASNPTNDR
ncbi:MULTISPECIES: AbrB family transcriptional regulator [Halomonas]|uniref:AbrB family transcriptional regulator n=1 Tax=Halomonas citrativorans TaxID=2742612 RepID=A0ABR9FF07_9GAMM|nr:MULTISPECIES: AbrB family transcriptional regulator [Halomonas]MBE0405085.1 AbrB family transcriptional regulator [Halomonas citrativorans]HCR97347.1 ammonia monooxygenase [Halomonas sp.]